MIFGKAVGLIIGTIALGQMVVLRRTSIRNMKLELRFWAIIAKIVDSVSSLKNEASASLIRKEK